MKLEKDVVKKQPKLKKKQPVLLKQPKKMIPFAISTREEQMSALGSLIGQKWEIKYSLLAIIDEFAPIRTPQPGDHLFEFQPKGQSFRLFASRSRNNIHTEKEIIYIATFCCKISEETIKKVQKRAKAFFYGIKIKLHEFPKTDLCKFSPRQGPNGQIYYDAGKMNAFFAKNLPKNTYTIAIITNLLIYNGGNPRQQVEEKWVFGLGSFSDRTCIVLKGFGGKRQKNQQDQSQLNTNFLIRVVNHEICHTFAMKHCIYYSCLMNGSNHYQEAVTKQEHLCPVCLRKLQLALNFNFVQRYEALGDNKSLFLAAKIRQAFALNPK